MKRLFCLLVVLFFAQPVMAANPASANIRININGAAADNADFLCLPDVGCLSVLAAQKGKVYPILHTIHVNSIYITNVDKGFRVTDEDAPASCKTVVNPGQTLTISGNLKSVANQNTMISQLHCTVTG